MNEEDESSPRSIKSSSVRAPASSSTCDYMADMKEEPDFIETNCHWSGCSREFETQDQLVKVRLSARDST